MSDFETLAWYAARERELTALALLLADRISVCSDILGRLAQKRPAPVLTEADYCPLGN